MDVKNHVTEFNGKNLMNWKWVKKKQPYKIPERNAFCVRIFFFFTIIYKQMSWIVWSIVSFSIKNYMNHIMCGFSVESIYRYFLRGNSTLMLFFFSISLHCFWHFSMVHRFTAMENIIYAHDWQNTLSLRIHNTLSILYVYE